MFEPVVRENSNRYERVVAQIKALIDSGEIKPGDQLPPERDLAKMLNVSRTSIREAMKVLAGSGLVNIRHGQGTFVAEIDSDSLIKQFATLLFFGQDRLRDIFEIRKVLETQSAAWAAERAREEVLVRMREVIDETSSHIVDSDIDPIIAARGDTRFHLCIAEASGNAVVQRIMNSLLDLLSESRTIALTIPGRAVRSISEHRLIYESILRGNPQEAAGRMMEHLEDVERSLHDTLSKEKDSTRS